jgi:hypothetical protein
VFLGLKIEAQSACETSIPDQKHLPDEVSYLAAATLHKGQIWTSRNFLISPWAKVDFLDSQGMNGSRG